jgi:tRNA pseudouridine55 synthase
MAILDRLKPLFSKSRLLVDLEEYEKEMAEMEKLKGKRRPKKGRFSRPGDRPKLGQGGTLDPLADGVLGELNSRSCVGQSIEVLKVLGVNRGTKVLGQFLECSKVSSISHLCFYEARP